VIQEALIGLFFAIRDFDPTFGVPFAGFADMCVSRQLQTAIKGATRLKHKALSEALSFDAGKIDDLGEPWIEHLEIKNEDPAQLVISSEAIESLRGFLSSSLTALEADVFALLIEGVSYAEMAQRLDRHLKAIDNSLQRIRLKIKSHLTQADAGGEDHRHGPGRLTPAST
jgi:RNA polymerase sporulation-specific sigma factor